jgi:spore maturation protein CgeB
VNRPLRIVILGLSVTSSWGNGHATNYRGLMRELTARGHNVLFLERDMPWYAQNRDLPEPPYGRTRLYGSLDELCKRYAPEVRGADLVVVGSFVPDGVEVGLWVTRTTRGVTAFNDIDTPVTLAKLERGDEEYLCESLIPRYDLYLSFTGGPTLRRLEEQYGSPCAKPFYCMVDPSLYYPEPVETRWHLGYLGTYSDDRQRTVERFLVEPALRLPKARFAVAGPMYPSGIAWPENVDRIEHLAPPEHRSFYCAQRFALNVTRAAMVKAGYAPSVRLFEAAACGIPVISDYWAGLEEFFKPGSEILVAESEEDVLRYLEGMSEPRRRAMGERARARVLAEHTAARRAEQLVEWTLEALERRGPASQRFREVPFRIR